MQLDIETHLRRIFERAEFLRQRRATIARLVEYRRMGRGLPC
jgi:hypothetical protein